MYVCLVFVYCMCTSQVLNFSPDKQILGTYIKELELRVLD
jgi:hypothetical protein